MNGKLIPLDCDDDVVLFEKDTFKVGRLKELAIREIRKKLSNHIYKDSAPDKRGDYIPAFLNHIFMSEQRLEFSEVQYNSFKNCQILKIGGKGWQKGQLNIKICIKVNGNQPDKVCLEFYADEPDEPESPLDDIRQMILAQK